MLDPRFQSRLLMSVAHVLRQPGLHDGLADPALRSDLITCAKLLERLAWEAESVQSEAAHGQAIRAIAAETCKLLGIDAPAPWPGLRLHDDSPVLIGKETGEERHDDTIFGRLGAASSSGSQNPAAALLRAYAEAEESFLVGRDPEAAGGLSSVFRRPDAKGSPTASEEQLPVSTDVDAENLTRYLRHRFPECPDVAASAVRKLVGGYSKSSVMFEITGAPCAGRVVMRKDEPIPGSGGSAVAEFPLICRAREIGVPVPEPLWAEADSSWFDGAFIIVRAVEGGNDISWAADPDAVRRFADDMARAAALIHTIRPADLGLADQAGRTAREAQRRHILWERERYRNAVEILNPRIEAAYGWLLANLPEPAVAEPVLVHAGMGFHNLMVMPDGRVSGILDWEISHFGDPADDLVYMQQFIPQVMPWADFMTRYIAHGGMPLRPEQEQFYAVWRSLRNACRSTSSLARYLGSGLESVKLAYAGMILGPRFELEALREIHRIMAP